MKIVTCLLLLIIVTVGSAQTIRIKGKISDNHNAPVIGANVYLEGTYDGASTDTSGNFSFPTSKKGKLVLVAKSVGYSEFKQEILIPEGNKFLEIKLDELSSELNEVVITAGMYQAGDRKRGVQLTSLDILTTANSNGDFIGALNTLPGTQNVGDDGGLFVRGGDRSEAKTFIDGLLVASPYTSKAPDLPTRGRFSPTLFSGTLFSTGGYSAEYGQALSAALILNTNNLMLKNPQSISILPFGFGASLGKTIDSTAFSLNLNYYNLKPYYTLVPQRTNWVKYPQSLAGEFISTSKLGDRTYLKLFSSASKGQSAMELPTQIDLYGGHYFEMNNNNYYLNALLTSRVGATDMKSGVSYSFDREDIDFKTASVLTDNSTVQLKQVFQWTIFQGTTFRSGAESFIQHYDQNFKQPDSAINAKLRFTNVLTAVFSEAESRLGTKISVRVGLRGEYASVNNETTLSPRISAAYKTGVNSQISLAYGVFNQMPKDDYLKVNNDLASQRALHYIMNYQYQKDGYLFRIEGYYKDYKHLTRFVAEDDYLPEDYSSNGYGHAKGLDIFWRDQKSIRNADYWLSFTLLDAKKKYENYDRLMYPTYFSKFNASGVYKQFFSKLNAQGSLTYQYSSGRPFHDPAGATYYTADLHNLSASISYLTRVFNKFTVVYLSASNILGFDQIYGYHFVKSASGDTSYEKIPIEAPAKRFYVVGVFISLNE